MKKIPVSEIQDGMILAQPITGSGGNVLLGTGMNLKASLGTRLNSWGISSVWIESSESPDNVTATSSISTSDKERIDTLFSGRLVNSAMRAIHRAILKHRGIDNGAE